MGTVEVEVRSLDPGGNADAQESLPARDANEQHELSSTEISAVTARLMTWGFLFLITIVPVAQLCLELWRGGPVTVQAMAAPAGSAMRRAVSGDWSSCWRELGRYADRDFLAQSEKVLEEGSIAKNVIQPKVQVALTGWLGYGNHKAVVGRDGWLYYQPGLDFIIGPDILNPESLASRARKMVNSGEARDPHSDSRPAILTMNAECRKAGIHLIVLPIPDKAMVEPSRLTRRMSSGGANETPSNAGYPALIAQLREAGVDVFEPMPSQLTPGRELYLKQDTHWRPQLMEEIAQRVAEHIRRAADPEIQSCNHQFEMREIEISGRGDLVDMLRLSQDQRVFRPQAVRIHQVIDKKTGSLWRPDEQSPVLLLGDSFTNIFSDPSMGWGQAAGFAEHLSYRLQCPIDVIALNGAGASGTRAELARAENRSRVARKRVILYQFAVRDLTEGNWKPIPLGIQPVLSRAETRTPPRTAQPTSTSEPVGEAAREKAGKGRPEPTTQAPQAATVQPLPKAPTGKATEASPPDAGHQLVIVGEILQISKLPDPGSVPYPDCLTFVRIKVDQVVSGSYEDTILVAVFLGMKDNLSLPAARYAPGQKLRLTLIPFRMADSQIRRTQRVDELDDYDHIPYYVVSEEPL